MKFGKMCGDLAYFRDLLFGILEKKYVFHYNFILCLSLFCPLYPSTFAIAHYSSKCSTEVNASEASEAPVVECGARTFYTGVGGTC